MYVNGRYLNLSFGFVYVYLCVSKSMEATYFQNLLAESESSENIFGQQELKSREVKNTGGHVFFVKSKGFIWNS